MKRVKRNPEERAERLGYNAGRKGHSYEDNPFDDATTKHVIWLDSWRRGKADYAAGFPVSKLEET